MQSEEKDKLQEIFDEFQKNNPMKLSDNFDKSFEEMLAKSKRREINVFFKSSFRYAAVAILLFITAIFYFSSESELTTRPQIAEKTDSSIYNNNDTILTRKEIIKIVEQPDDLYAVNFDPINFEDNPVLEGYYGQMRTNLSCEINSPKQGKVFEYKRNGANIIFDGTIKDTEEKDSELVIKIYLGSIQKPMLKRTFSLSESRYFSFLHKFDTPGQYSWKVVADGEILYAGNFFLGKSPAK